MTGGSMAQPTSTGSWRRCPTTNARRSRSSRATIRAVVPTATEGISHGIPTFKLDGRPLVAIGAYRVSTAVST
jgi:uncharacterized protein YdhG (YjbR/CyaY superfamily)